LRYIPINKLMDKNSLKEFVQITERAPNEIMSIVEILGLKPKAKLLDLCCGYGRHSIPLSNMGYKVVGFEISESLLEKAKQQAKQSSVEVDFVFGDMRKLSKKVDGDFDAVINIFTSFGFYTKDSDNQKALNEVAKVLKPGGNFLIDLANRENILKNFKRRQWFTYGDYIVLEENIFDFFSSRLETKRTYIGKDDSREISNFSIRLYSLHEMLAMINKAGLSTSAIYGDFDMKQYSVDSRRMIILAQKPIT